MYRLGQLRGSSPLAVRFQVFQGAGLPVPTTMVLVSTSNDGVCHGAPPPWLQASALPVGLFGSLGQVGALGSPVGVLGWPFRRPTWPSTMGRAHTSLPVSGSRA